MSCRYMWPPVKEHEPRETRAVITDFPSWAEHNEGALTGLLALYKERGPLGGTRVGNLVSTQFAPVEQGMRSRLRCKDTLPDARALLASFDLVGVTSCMTQLLDSLALRMRLPPDTVMQRRARRSAIRKGKLVPMQVRPVTNFPSQPAYKMARYWTWSTLNASSQERLWQLTRCDADLYAYALRLAKNTLNWTCSPKDTNYAQNLTRVKAS